MCSPLATLRKCGPAERAERKKHFGCDTDSTIGSENRLGEGDSRHFAPRTIAKSGQSPAVSKTGDYPAPSMGSRQESVKQTVPGAWLGGWKRGRAGYLPPAAALPSWPLYPAWPRRSRFQAESHWTRLVKMEVGGQLLGHVGQMADAIKNGDTLLPFGHCFSNLAKATLFRSVTSVDPSGPLIPAMSVSRSANCSATNLLEPHSAIAIEQGHQHLGIARFACRIARSPAGPCRPPTSEA